MCQHSFGNFTIWLFSDGSPSCCCHPRTMQVVKQEERSGNPRWWMVCMCWCQGTYVCMCVTGVEGSMTGPPQGYLWLKSWISNSHPPVILYYILGVRQLVHIYSSLQCPWLIFIIICIMYNIVFIIYFILYIKIIMIYYNFCWKIVFASNCPFQTIDLVNDCNTHLMRTWFT